MLLNVSEAFSDDGMDGMDNGMDADTDAAQAGGAGRIAPMLVGSLRWWAQVSV